MTPTPKIFVVLGMHKSGTTLVSKLLMDSGINMGEFVSESNYDVGNHLERTETQSINKSILGCGDQSSLKLPEAIDPKKISPECYARAKDLIDNLNIGKDPWGFKDPRTCLAYDFWLRILPPHQLVAIYRCPREVTAHYFQRGFPAFSFLRATFALHAWCVYNKQILNILKKSGHAVLLKYSELMNNEKELKRLEEFIGRPVADCRSKTQYRSSPMNGTSFNLCHAIVSIITGNNPRSIEEELDAMLEIQKNRFNHQVS